MGREKGKGRGPGPTFSLVYVMPLPSSVLLYFLQILTVTKSLLLEHREQKCADTINTVPVPWAGHFQC